MGYSCATCYNRGTFLHHGRSPSSRRNPPGKFRERKRAEEAAETRHDPRENPGGPRDLVTDEAGHDKNATASEGGGWGTGQNWRGD